MSVVEPQPPPPPPPPPPQRSPGFDFLRPFTFVFDDPRWVPKILLGGVFVLACVVIIGIFFIYGYLARLVRNVADGVEPVLPEWDDLGEFFSEGLRFFLVKILYAVPFLVLVILVAIPMGVLGAFAGDSESVQNAIGGLGSCLSCLMMPIGLAYAVWLPAALVICAVSRDVRSAFDFRRIAAFIKANLANYIVALLVALVAQIAGEFIGLVTLCTCLVFTLFWGMVVAAFSLAQVYRHSPVK